ncbi:hypothetical protein N0V90_006858 [Kalmusia sp. IMI 367209]|nr:hypothetical protein N0V90_006858 [Kalmusia sp. IMI 367209]
MLARKATINSQVSMFQRQQTRGVGSKLCVYTNTSFSHGRGISIFTTPELAEKFAALPPFEDPDALRGINEFSGNWYTQEMPGKGMGMLAKRDLKFRDKVTAYTPALLAYLESDLSTAERERFFRIAVSQLPEATRVMYLQLATVYGLPQVKYQDVVKANTFQLEVSGYNHLAVFPETSRLNHACSPNAQYYLDPSLLTHFVQITRPIAEGEEITISSLDRTDATLREIHVMQQSLNDWSDSSAGTPELAEKLLGAYQQEGLEGFMDVPYGYSALAYNAAGDTKTAVKYAQLAEELILMKDGEWAPNLRIWKELLKDPKQHWSFRRRL